MHSLDVGIPETCFKLKHRKLGMEIKALIFSLSVLASSAASAECTAIGEQAIKTCRSEQALNGAQNDSQGIFSRFKPNNNRMSPESCQGFKDSYDDYKNLTDEYIGNCKKMIDQLDECIVGIYDKPKGPSTMEDLRKATDLQQQSVAELPKLLHLKAPMPKMKSMLDDCMRETQGQRIKNTNTNRGDAKSEGQASAGQGSAGSDQASSGGGSGSGGGGSGGGSGGGGSSSGDSNSNGTKTAEKKALVGQGSTQIAAGAAVLNPTGATVIPPSARADGANGASLTGAQPSAPSSLARLVEHQKVMKRLGQRRPASATEAQGITGPHTNMFINIKGRYLDIRSRGDLL